MVTVAEEEDALRKSTTVFLLTRMEMEQISTILKGLVLPAILCGFVLCNL